MEFLLILVANVACVFTLIAVHEAGHYLAGWAGGIPRREMRVRLLAFPQHVVLRDGDAWVPPFDLERYVGLMRRHLTSAPRLFLYTAGGLLMETVFTTVAVLAAKSAGWPGVALMIAGQSLCLFAIYVLVMDLPMALRRGYPWGDVSGLWFIARGPTALLVTALLLVRGLLLWYVLA
ncbi:MAG TPA: hypothetical protein VF170_16550 [Planctomycetaceae bacterium]